METAGRTEKAGNREENRKKRLKLILKELFLLGDLMMERGGRWGLSAYSKIKCSLCPTSKINTAILTFVPIPSISQQCLQSKLAINLLIQ